MPDFISERSPDHADQVCPPHVDPQPLPMHGLHGSSVGFVPSPSPVLASSTEPSSSAPYALGCGAKPAEQERQLMSHVTSPAARSPAPARASLAPVSPAPAHASGAITPNRVR